MESPPPLEPAAAPSRWPPLVLVAIPAVVVLTLWAIGRWQTPPETLSDDEPAAFASPYLNTQPGVQYVGDKVCADCHNEAKTYKHHPMGQSAALMSRARPLESSGNNAKSTFEALGSLFEVQRRGQKVVHREIFRAQGRVI